jgi:metallo-beta-lactamase class B
MNRNIVGKIVLLAWLLGINLFAAAQHAHEPSDSPAEWSKPYKPFRIAGNLYYVGTYDLSCYLITTSKGHILINTGLAASAPMIKANVERLGFKFSDIKILLTTQAHYDHIGAMATVKKMTGARMMVDVADSAVVADGGNSDYEFGGKGSLFEPVKVDRSLRDGDTIKLGGMSLVMLHHPGHTKGSCSYLFDVKDKQKSYRVLIVNMPTIITGRDLTGIDAYPGIAKDYEYTFDALKKLSFDLWVSSHASQFGLHTKHKPSDGYKPEIFIDREGYDKAVTDLQNKFLRKLQGE